MWHYEWIRAVADRDAPVRDGALGIGCDSFGEGLDAIRVEERMHQREAAVEFLLRLRCAGGLEVHATELLRPGRRGKRACYQRYRKRSCIGVHNIPSFIELLEERSHRRQHVGCAAANTEPGSGRKECRSVEIAMPAEGTIAAHFIREDFGTSRFTAAT